MLFWTVIFITYTLAVLVNGNLFYNDMQKAGELFLQNAITEDKTEKERLGKEIIKAIWKMFLIFPLIIVMIVYLFKAIQIDIYKYPSIIMLFYSLFTTFVFNNKKIVKHDLSTEEDRNEYRIYLKNIKKYTLKGFITEIVYLIYFVYMFWILTIK